MNKKKLNNRILLVGKGIPSKEYWLKELNDNGYLLNCIDVEHPGKLKKYFLNFYQLDKMDDVANSSKSIATHLLNNDWQIDGVLCIEEMYVPLAINLARFLNVVSIASPDHASGLRNKYLMRNSFTSFGIKNPNFRLIKNKDDLRNAIINIGVPCVLKPVEMAGSLGVYKLNSVLEGENYYEISKKCDFKDEHKRLFFGLSSDCLIEDYIDGEEWSIELAVQEGKCSLLAITSKVTGPEPYFDETMHLIYNSKEYISNHNYLVELAIDGVNALSIKNAICHIEIKSSSKEISKIIEIAARPGGDQIPYIIQLATKVNVVKLAADIALGNSISFNINSEINKVVLIGFINSDKAGIIKRFNVNNISEFNDKSNRVTVNKYYDEGQVIYIDSGNLFARLGNIIVQSDDPQKAISIYKQVLENIELNVSED